jgi:hypothetical protein
MDALHRRHQKMQSSSLSAQGLLPRLWFMMAEVQTPEHLSGVITGRNSSLSIPASNLSLPPAASRPCARSTDP